MSDPNAYILLVSSLPRSERLFRAKQPPLSRERLEMRLRLLSDEHADRLAVIERLLSWSAHAMSETDAEAVRSARSILAEIPEATLRAVVAERLEMRTIVAALRHRNARGALPERPWGIGASVRTIEENWSERTFGLDRRHPWLRRAAELSEAGDALGLERHLLDTTFRQLQRHGAAHLFDFEAVVIYVLKWNIFDRWTRGNIAAATERFEEMTQSALRVFDPSTLEGALA